MSIKREQETIQSAITRKNGDGGPTIERGSYGDRGVLEGNRPDGVGEASNEVDSTTQSFVKVVVESGSPLTAHASEIAGMLGPTATYSGHTGTHPSTGSPMPKGNPDENYYKTTGAKQQRG